VFSVFICGLKSIQRGFADSSGFPAPDIWRWPAGDAPAISTPHSKNRSSADVLWSQSRFPPVSSGSETKPVPLRQGTRPSFERGVFSRFSFDHPWDSPLTNTQLPPLSSLFL